MASLPQHDTPPESIQDAGATKGIAARHAKYVHLNPVTGDVDMVFPARLEAKDFDHNPGPLKHMTVVLANHSEPTFHTRIASVSGTTTYDYVVSNADVARQAIFRIYMILPTFANDATCSATMSWICLKPFATPGDEGALYYVRPQGLFLPVVTPFNGGHPVEPGSSLEFHVRSKALPGFIRSYVQSGFVDAPADLPGEVSAELQPYLTIDRSTRRALIVGPAFASGTPVSTMARHLENAITQLAFEGVIDRRRSEFMMAALSVLHAARTTNTAQPVPTWVPATEAEREIDALIRYDVGRQHE